MCHQHEPTFLDRAQGTDIPLPPVAHILVCDIPEGWYELDDGTPVPAQEFYFFISPDDASTVFTADQRAKAMTFQVRDDGTVFYEYNKYNNKNVVDMEPYLVTEEELAAKVYAAARVIDARGTPRRPSLYDIELICTGVEHCKENLGMLRHCMVYNINFWSLM